MKDEEIKRIWRQVSPTSVITDEGLAICRAVAKAERERCIQACRDEYETYGGDGGIYQDCIDAIEELD